MTRRTLAGRVALVQAGTALVALAVALVGTSLLVAALLERQSDEMLTGTGARVTEMMSTLGAYAQDADFLERELGEIRPSAVRVEVQDPAGFVLATSGPGPSAGTAAPGCRDGGRLRICATKSGVFTVVTALERTPNLHAVRDVTIALLLVVCLAGAVVMVLSQRIARHALSPLATLTERIARLEPGAGMRLDAVSPLAELELLRTRFDELAVRFDAALARERRFTAHASHEIRTPLGLARAEIEALSLADVESGRARALAAMDHLSALVDALLWFARAQGRLDDEKTGIVNMADVVRARIEERGRSDPGKTIAATLPDEALVRGDEHLLGLVTSNLLDNALKHGTGDSVVVSAELGGPGLRLLVTNAGQPPPDEAGRLFEPFYRGAESAELPGFGLGLPFAREVARAHGGDLELTRVSDAGCTTFMLTLPLVEWSDSSGCSDSV